MTSDQRGDSSIDILIKSNIVESLKYLEVTNMMDHGPPFHLHTIKKRF
jgi:hypothetical protein